MRGTDDCVVSDVVSLKERGKYQGITGSVVAVSNSLGPVLGGILTERATWRWVLLLDVDLADSVSSGGVSTSICLCR